MILQKGDIVIGKHDLPVVKIAVILHKPFWVDYKKYKALDSEKNYVFSESGNWGFSSLRLHYDHGNGSDWGHKI